MGNDMELKPCPLCGNGATISHASNSGKYTMVNCIVCGCNTGKRARSFDAIQRWNHRIEPAQPVEASQDEVAMIDRLKEWGGKPMSEDDVKAQRESWVRAFSGPDAEFDRTTNPASLSPASPQKDGDAQIAPRTDVVNPSDAKDGGGVKCVLGCCFCDYEPKGVADLIDHQNTKHNPNVFALSAMPPRNSLREMGEERALEIMAMGSVEADGLGEITIKEMKEHPLLWPQLVEVLAPAYRALLAALDAQTVGDK